ncbi:MAG TPA: hypothetical protein VK391_04785, partial [Allosphingosinicella sp.]|nr:hypothetical protein [Allosphingosinicella sp.]
MKKQITYGSLLLLSTALTAPAAFAQASGQSASPQSSGVQSPAAAATPAHPAADAEQPEEEIQVSAPGADD